MITIKTTAAFVSTLVVSNAFASNYDTDWVEISRDKSAGMAVSLSAASFDRKGDHADVLVKLVYDKPTSTLLLAFPTEKVISQWSIDCANRTAAIGRSTGYGVQLDQIHTIDGQPDNYRTFKPGTFGYTVTQFACTHNAIAAKYVPMQHGMACMLPAPPYSPVARRRGYQGRVDVSYIRKASGEMTDIRVVTSSGHEELDQAAVESIKGAMCEPLADGADRRGTQPFSFELSDGGQPPAQSASQDPQGAEVRP